MSIRFLTLMVLVLSVAFSAASQGLESRNIPDARLLYEDESGRYFGAMMSFRDNHPDASAIEDVVLKVYAERKVHADGTFFNATPARAVPYQGAPEQEGIHYGEDEIKRMSEHVIPAIDRVFPEWSSHRNWRGYKDWVMVGVYIEGLYLEPYSGGSTASYEAEEPVFRISFMPSPDGRGWRPPYEKNGLLGDPVSIDWLNVPNVRERRKAIASEETDDRSKILALFERHEQQSLDRKARRLNAYFEHMKSKRRIGIVYKSGTYWSQFDNFEAPRNVIEGNLNFIAHPGDFAEAYLTFIDQYYHVCEPYLPARRTTYTETWFETRYGMTSKTGSFYVEMDPRFEVSYERMGDVRYRRDASSFVNSIVNSMGERDGRSPFAFVAEAFASVASDLVSDRETARFLRQEGCDSQIVLQYAENLWRGASGLPPVQGAEIRYRGAGSVSDLYTRADATRYLEETFAALARNPKPGIDGYPYYDEELAAYRTGMGMANDARGQVPAMRAPGLALQKRGYPVLYCHYGPIGRLDNGELDSVSYAFWYGEKPAELDQLLAARTNPTDVYKGMNHARSTCPFTSDEALEIIASTPGYD